MARYDYKCKQHGFFEVEKPMEEAGRPEMCPECETQLIRVFAVPPIHYHSDGFHATDYFKGSSGVGTKQDQLRTQYEKSTGEKAPPPAADVPRTTKDKY